MAELTLGFWVSLLNTEYERTLWQALRRAFPYMPRRERQRRNVSAPLNTFRRFRNRIFHNESICPVGICTVIVVIRLSLSVFRNKFPLAKVQRISTTRNFQKKGVRVTERRCTKGLHPV